MKKYAVAIQYDGSKLELHIMERKSAVDAVKMAMRKGLDSDTLAHQIKWELDMPNNLSELKKYLWEIGMVDVECIEL